MRKKALEIKEGDFVLLEKHWLSSRRQMSVAKFGPNFAGSFKILEVVNSNLGIDDFSMDTIFLH